MEFFQFGLPWGLRWGEQSPPLFLNLCSPKRALRHKTVCIEESNQEKREQVAKENKQQKREQPAEKNKQKKKTTIRKEQAANVHLFIQPLCVNTSQIFPVLICCCSSSGMLFNSGTMINKGGLRAPRLASAESECGKKLSTFQCTFKNRRLCTRIIIFSLG